MVCGQLLVCVILVLVLRTRRHVLYLLSIFVADPRWRHQMETYSTLLVICEGNPLVTIGFRSHKGQWRGALMFSLICTRINDWATIETPVIWDAIALILWRHCNAIKHYICGDTTTLFHVTHWNPDRDLAAERNYLWLRQIIRRLELWSWPIIIFIVSMIKACIHSRPTSIIQRHKHKNGEKYGLSTRFRLQTPTHPISHIEDWHLWLVCRSLDAHRFYSLAVNIIYLARVCPLRGYVRDMSDMLQRFIWIHLPAFRWNNNAVEIYINKKKHFEMNSYIWP